MGEKTTRIDFEIASGYPNMSARDKDFIRATEIRRDMELKSTQAEYERHREARYKNEEERLIKNYKLDFTLPRPPNTPPQRMKTAQEIRDEAVQKVDKQHELRKSEILNQAQQAIRERVERSLQNDRGHER